MPFIVNAALMKCQVSKVVAGAIRYLGPTRRLDCLDIGCSSGIAEIFLNNYFRNIVAVDIDQGLLTRSRPHNLPGPAFLCSDALSMPFKKDSFDLTIAFSLLHHLTFIKQLRVLEGARYVTRNGGLIIMLEYNPFNPVTRLVVRANKQDEGSVLITPARIRQLYKKSGLDIIGFNHILFGCKYMIVGRK